MRKSEIDYLQSKGINSTSMRERTVKVDTTKLELLSSLYRPSKVAKRLDISKQRWRNYETGKNDVPDSVVDRLCSEFNLSRSDIVLDQ